MSIASNFPAIKPTLLLDFANTEQLDPRITFTRASTATYYGTQTAKAEENLLLQSQAFDAGNWVNPTLNVTVAANTSIAPDGTTTADTATFTSSSAYRYQRVSTGILAGRTFTASVWLASSTKSSIALRVANTTAGADQAYTGVTLTPTLTRYTVTYTFTGSGSSIDVGLDNRTTYSDGATGDVIVWGWQLEERSAVTAYTPTTDQPITNYIPVLETAASGVARFDHNPTTFESLGLLIEEQRTNLLLRSEEFETVSWTKAGSSVTSNATISPDGTVDADKLVEDTSTGEHKVTQTATLVSGTTYTLSFYAKSAGRTAVGFYGAGGLASLAGTVDLSTGSVISGTVTTQNVGNGWWRISCAGASTFSGANSITIRNYAVSGSYTGDGYSGIYIWGAQLEAGAFATSYIPTVASQVTRAADAASMTGANFSSWYNQAEGTLYVEARPSEISQTRYTFTISDGGATNQFLSSVGLGTNWFYVGAANISKAGWVVNAFGKLGGVYKVDDFAVTINGATVSTDTSGPIVSTFNQLQIGDRAAGSRNLCGHIRKLSYYPVRASDAQLQGLTS